DLDLESTVRGTLPNLPAPPTGHDLMALFPPPAPSITSMPHNRRTEATSGYFHLQERAYFAQAGKEIVRVRRRIRSMELDTRRRNDEVRVTGSSAPHHQLSPHLMAMRNPRDHRDDREHSASPRDIHAKPSIPNLRRMSIDSAHPLSPPKSRYAYPPESEHESRELRLTPSEYMSPTSVYSHPDDADEAWRRPMPHGERRRAGKHTRRVIVKN
ncbi:hypothetical protein BDP27DRAFT_1214156, partial [Rhodocollybia butyracea]